ncbi:ribosome-binding factor A [Fulvitalea axinellae]|uniref:Ribosome-binding factor A n=1 Tax=Fulvitalea axinellae TaxID=1182444 RepID=A0AAU9CLD2_9BACT|nr:ribosome-binding factor A [Fulvitalea axinellae]
MESKRQQKFSRLIQKDLGHIFQHEVKGLLNGAWVTVTEVKMSPDLGVAKAYLSIMIADKDATMALVNEHKSEIRKRLGMKIGKQVRIVPELVFQVDNTLENASRINELLGQIEIPDEDKVDMNDYPEGLPEDEED